jgi:hypothetical protein
MNLWRDYLDEQGLTATHAIIGVDPGDMTGFYVCLVHNEGVMFNAFQVDADHCLIFMESMMTVLVDAGVPRGRFHVAIEKYQITRRTIKLTRQPAALEVTGVCKAVAMQYDAHIWEFGMSSAKKFASDDLLERILWVPKRGRRTMRHARDAARQVWSCLAEVDFPTWEASWECSNRLTDMNTSVRVSLSTILTDTGDEDDD